MILADYQVNGQSPSKVATAGTGQVFFPRLLGTNFGVAPSTPTLTNATGQLNLPGSQYFAATNGTRLRFIASGTVTTGAVTITPTITMSVNTGTLTTPLYTTVVSVAQAQATASTASWFLEAHVVIGGLTVVTAGNFAGAIVSGQQTAMGIGMSNNLPAVPAWAAAAATTNPISWVNTATQSVSGLVVGVTFGTANAANAATLNEFVILGD